MKINLKALDYHQLEDFFESTAEARYRAKQLFKWIYKKGVSSFDDMTDLSAKLKAKLKNIAYISELKLVERKISGNKDTEKYLFELEDGNTIESVLMRYEEDLGIGRVTACVSTQAGCAIGCSFCATGKSGFTRNLEFHEIVDQVLQIQNMANNHQERICNIVFMGMGEPLLNYDNVMKAIRVINHPEGLSVGVRHFAISTCGIIPGILKLADEEMQVKLAVSLHIADDKKRTEIMPINAKYPLKELIEALKTYQKKTKRRIVFEYAPIKDFNDSEEDIKQFAELIKDIKCLVNIIPVNPVRYLPSNGVNEISGSEFCPPQREKVKKIKEIMERCGLKATLRKSRGSDIDGACGQLRGRKVEG